jgi:multiple sugar transport system permease protein
VTDQPAQPALAITTQHRQRSAADRRAAARPGPRRAHLHPARRIGGRAIEIILLSAFAVLVVAPIYWALVTSLRTPAQSFSNPPDWIPTDAQWSNYSAVFSSVPFWDFLLNSFLVTGLIVVGQTVTSCLSGYAFARLQFRGREPLFWALLATMMVPIQATIIPVFLLIKEFGLVNSRIGLVLPVVGTAFGTFLMRQYFLQMPKELGEAATVDGANQWQVFYKVYARLAGPPLATLAVLAFAAYWNEFFRPLIFLSTPSKFTLPLGLVTLQGYLGTGSVSVVLAGVILSLIPTLIVFLVAQRRLVEGLTFGSVKG